MIDLETALAANPLIAILRGLDPTNAEAVSDVLVDAGFKIIEVPLNSPDPLDSIARIAKRHGDRVIVGAGTVLGTADVEHVANAGGRVIVAPNMNAEVGCASIERGLYWCPGVMTPTEAFGALELGASMLKIFPAEAVPPAAIAAMRAVLPGDAVVAVVGGMTPATMKPYREVGANGFGLGSALFKPGFDLSEIEARAKAFVTAVREMS